MNGNEFEVVERVKDFNTFYFIESHLKTMLNDIEVIIESSHKYIKPLRKILEKEFKTKNEEYTISVYGIDFKPALIKKKEIKDINGIQSFDLNIRLKIKKNKFDSQNLININKDSFNPFIKFEMMKKIFGKDVFPPPQCPLTNLEIIQIFKEALIVKERKKIDDPTFQELLKFGVILLKSMEKYELILFLMLYVDILNINNLQLIKEIFEIFNFEKIIKPLNSNALSEYQEKMELLYNDQKTIFEKIKKMPLCNFKSYLIKFYTIHIYMYFTAENMEACERIMVDLRDNNPYDNLILAKLYFSEYAQFYKNIPISIEMQNSLMGKFIYSSENYANLLTSFSLISEYIKKDFVNLLLIITENYDKINEICLKSNSALNINEFVVQTPNDDVNKIQNYLDIIVKKKLENKFKCININLNMWDFYLSNNNNSNFLEYLKSYLIIGSLSYNEIIESLLFITRYTNKDFVELLKIMVDNYDKLKSICMTETKQIIINDFIVQNVNDNQEKIKEYYTQIASRKIKDSYETIFFDINIWKFYILNHCPFEFLSYIEKKIYESSLFSRDIFDCLSFSADLRNKSFIPMLEIILNHLDKIQNIFKNEMKNIFIDSYIIQQQTDDLSKIYELIKEIIEKEKNNMYCSIKFSVNLWLPYSQTDKLDILKYIRKIINVCRSMEPELN